MVVNIVPEVSVLILPWKLHKKMESVMNCLMLQQELLLIHLNQVLLEMVTLIS